MAFPGAPPPDPTSADFCTGSCSCGVGVDSEGTGSLVTGVAVVEGAPSGADEEMIAPDENCIPP